ncbi:MAG: nitrous oxide-stimulated promoter family protein [Phocaeicola sp.]
MNKQQEADFYIVSVMIERYCKDHHATISSTSTADRATPYTQEEEQKESCKAQLCATCTALLNYAQQRIERCPLGSEKKLCQGCKIHCYAPQKRSQIREVMKYSGKRILFTHPLTTLRHLIQLLKHRYKTARENA